MEKLLFLILLLPMQLFAQRDNILIDCNFDTGLLPAKINSQKCCTYSQTFTTDTTRYGTGQAYRFELRSNDPDAALNKRTELAENGITSTEQWYGYSTLVPANFSNDTIKNLLSQWHGTADPGEAERNPPISLRIQNDRYNLLVQWSALALNSDTAGHTILDGSVQTDLGPVNKNQWVDWIWHIKFSYGNDGIIEGWRNGHLIYSRYGPNSYNDKKPPYFKCGLYIPTWNKDIVTPGVTSRVIYFDELWISKAIPNPSSNATLGKLLVSGIKLTPVFSPMAINYMATVPNTTTSVQVTPVTNNVYATVKINATIVTPGWPSGKIPLSLGPNKISTVVTAQDGTTKTYTITIIRPSTNPNLSGLTISSGILMPAFAQATTNYADTVINAISNITVTPTTANKYATVKVNGKIIGSDSASQKITLTVGNTRIRTAVRAENGATKTYVIIVTRLKKASSANTIKGALVQADIIKPALKTNELLKISIYPNPAALSFNLKMINGDAKNKLLITVRNLQGKVMYQANGNIYTPYTFGQNFAPGIYIAEIVNGKFSKAVKLIKALN